MIPTIVNSEIEVELARSIFNFERSTAASIQRNTLIYASLAVFSTLNLFVLNYGHQSAFVRNAVVVVLWAIPFSMTLRFLISLRKGLPRVLRPKEEIIQAFRKTIESSGILKQALLKIYEPRTLDQLVDAALVAGGKQALQLLQKRWRAWVYQIGAMGTAYFCLALSRHML
ncbi:MAG: hypothetical protein ACXVCH_09785 [Bdellovibrionota bacterium]